MYYAIFSRSTFIIYLIVVLFILIMLFEFISNKLITIWVIKSRNYKFHGSSHSVIFLEISLGEFLVISVITLSECRSFVISKKV